MHPKNLSMIQSKLAPLVRLTSRSVWRQRARTEATKATRASRNLPYISLRGWLLCLAILAGSASLVIAAVAGWWSWQEQKNRIGASLMATSRAITEAVDREIDQAAALARGLSISTLLAHDDFAGFERQARQAIDLYRYNLVLTSPNSEFQLVNTQVPLGAEPPKLLSGPIDPVLRQGRVHVSPLLHPHLSDAWLTAVQVPVLSSDGQLRFVISILVPSTAFQRIIEEQHLPTSWSPVILDGDWTVVARDISRSKFLGQKGAAQEFQNAPDGLHEVRLLDGDRALSAHSHSRRYGWTAAVAMPTSAMMGEALTPILAAALSGFAVAALAIGAVLFFAARIGGNIASLAAVTRALATGERIELPRFLVRELAMVGDGMQQAAAEIAASRYDLEARIAEATRELHRESEEHRRAEAALAQAQKMEAIGQLTGGIAHDFNNLLTAIQGSIELIDCQAKLDPETLARLLGPARSAAERGAALTHGLLAFSRQQALSPQDIDINRHVGGISELLRRTLGEAIVIETVLAGGLWHCFADPNQLESALLNIAVNARDSMPDSGKLTIETGNTYLDEEYAAHEDVSPGQYVLLAVTDTGTGMSPEIMMHASEPFFTTKEPGKGTGLGLSQVYGFIKQSGGHIKFYSEVGLGTTVKVYLPRSSSEAMPERVPDRSASIMPGNGETVLLVEDDAQVREFSASALAHLGYRVLEASESSTALDILAEHSEIVLLLTDVGLPGLNGRQLAEEARRRVPRLKVVYMTGYARNAIVHHGVLDAGVDLLAKPFTTEGLGRKLQEVLGRN